MNRNRMLRQMEADRPDLNAVTRRAIVDAILVGRQIARAREEYARLEAVIAHNSGMLVREISAITGTDETYGLVAKRKSGCR